MPPPPKNQEILKPSSDPISSVLPAEVFKELSMSDVTQLISKIELGEPDAAERLLPLVYSSWRPRVALTSSLGRRGNRWPSCMKLLCA